MLGEKWKALSDDERRPYVEKAAADKKRYDEEKKSYLVRDYPFSPRMINGALTFLHQAGDADEEEESS